MAPGSAAVPPGLNGIRSIPQRGHFPGSFIRICGCIEQVHMVAFVVSDAWSCLSTFGAGEWKNSQPRKMPPTNMRLKRMYLFERIFFIFQIFFIVKMPLNV
jgi:hypothetical protein